MISDLAIHVRPYSRYLILAWIASMFFEPDPNYIASLFNAEEWTWYWQGIFSTYCFYGFQIVILLVFAKVLKVKWHRLFGERVKIVELIPAMKLTLFLLLFSFAAMYALFIPLSFVNSGFVQWWLDISRSEPLFLSGTSGNYFLPNVLKFLAAVLFTPILEEILFRGFLLHRWSYKWSLRIAIGVSSLLFAIFHADPIGAFVFGVGMCILYLKTKSLYVPILCHAANNLIAYVIVAVISTYDVDGPEYEYTIEAFRNGWYIGLIPGVIVIIGAVVFLRSPKKPQEWELPSV